MSINKSLLVIEKGLPFKKGYILYLDKDEMLIGRVWENINPDIALMDYRISRKHAFISLCLNQATITDLDSKHGTAINDVYIEPNKPYGICHGDKISLAHETAIFIFNQHNTQKMGETIDFSSELSSSCLSINLNINIEKKEIAVDDVHFQFYGKDLDLLCLLYENSNRAISYDEIKMKVWPERIIGSYNCVPDVGNDEITALAYRLRKRLGIYEKCIKSIPRFGYIFEK